MIVNRLPVPAQGEVFGVVWDYNSTSTALTRLTPSTDPNGYVTMAVTKKPSPAIGTGGGSSPFDNYAPWKDMDEYNIVNGAVSYRKGESGFSRSSYETMVYIPAFYCKIVNDTSGKKMYFYVSNAAISGFTLHPGSGCYVGRYHTGSGYVSRTGLEAVNGKTRATFRTNSHSKGANWWQWGIAQLAAIQLLYVVEFADWNSQEKIGNGRAYNSGTAQNSGGTDTMTYHTGRASGTENQAAVQYRHIENLWGNYYNFIDGINFSNRAAYVCTDPSKWTDNTSGTNYTYAGLTLPSSNGYIKMLKVSSNFPWLFLPTSSDARGATSVPDYVDSNTGWSIAHVAGNYSASSPGKYGMFYLDGGLSSTTTNANLGSRLLFTV